MGIPERKEREREHRREEILDAAQKVFFEKSLQTATMDEVAEAAELSKATLYLYYKSKEDLYLAVFLRGMRIMYDMFSRVIARDEPTLKLIRNLGEAYLDFFKQHRHYFRMLQFFETPQFHKQVSEDMLAACSASDQQTWKLITDLLQRAVDEGFIIESVSPRELAIIFWSTSTTLMRQLDRGDDYWQSMMKVDLESSLRLANRLVLESVLTDEGKKQLKMISEA